MPRGIGGGRRPNILRELTGKPTQAVIPQQTSIRVTPLRAVPKCPAWIKDALAIEQWDEIAPVMIEHKLLTKSNLPMLALMVATFGRIVEGYTARKNGSINTALLAQYRTLVNDFGLMPCSQLRIRLPEATENENPFLHNRKAA